MGDNHSNKRNGGRKKICERKPALITQFLGLVSARKALEALQFCLCGFLKHFQRSDALPAARQMSRTPNLRVESEFDFQDLDPPQVREIVSVQQSSEVDSGAAYGRSTQSLPQLDILDRNIEVIMRDPHLAPVERASEVYGLWSCQLKAKTRIAELERERSALLNKVHELERSLGDFQKSSAAAHEEIGPLKNEINALRLTEARLQKTSQEHESCAATIQLLNATVVEFQVRSEENQSCGKSKPGIVDLHPQLNAISGWYADESATPVLLDQALTITRTSVKRFQNDFVEAVNLKCDPASIVHLLYQNHFFARPNHVSYAARAAFYEVLFKGFEHESFNTCFGDSRFLDPDVRRARFYDYFLRERERNDTGDIRDDPQFEAFCEKKLYRLWKIFNLRLENFQCERNKKMKMAYLKHLGGPQLLSRFRAAARCVWLLHKLAFSFPSPASIFRVEQGASLDPNYMESVVSLDDHERFVPHVGFMIAPGFCLRKTVLRCEVYLASAN